MTRQQLYLILKKIEEENRNLGNLPDSRAFREFPKFPKFLKEFEGGGYILKILEISHLRNSLLLKNKTLSDSLRNLGNSRDSQVFGEFPRFLKESEGVLVFNHWKFLILTILKIALSIPLLKIKTKVKGRDGVGGGRWS